jgi:uracil phosphoribosyltransferase
VRTTIVDHPLAAERLTTIRDESTDPAGFRRALNELSWLLVYEATRDLEIVATEVTTPLTSTTGTRVEPVPLIVPVLRAGLGMLQSAHTMLPRADVGFVGLRRNEVTLESEEYVTTVPEDLGGRPVLILDPMLATGGSLCHAAGNIADHNPGRMIVVCVLAAPEGIARVEQAGFDADIVTASVDERLNEVGFIVPGLGDAGDRQFGMQ